jgi:hypothetical protein
VPSRHPPGGRRSTQDAGRRGGQHQPGFDRVVAADLLQEDGDHEEGPLQDQPLHVLGRQSESGDAVAEEPGRHQRFPARPLPRADVPEEHGQEARADPGEQPHRRNSPGGQHHHPADGEVGPGDQPAVGARLQDAEDHEEQARRGQCRADDVEPLLARRRGRLGDP